MKPEEEFSKWFPKETPEGSIEELLKNISIIIADEVSGKILKTTKKKLKKEFLKKTFENFTRYLPQHFTEVFEGNHLGILRKFYDETYGMILKTTCDGIPERMLERIQGMSERICEGL